MEVTIICGPTAVGKTAYAIEQALQALEQNSEIISADSGQVYRGLNIGTAKPSREEQAKVPFHLIDIIDPSERFSAAGFRTFALEKIKEITSRGKRPFVVGGTGLYIKVLEGGIFEGPSADPDLRRNLEVRIRNEGLESLFSELERKDPEAARQIDRHNRQRLIRALEVCLLTGGKISEFWNRHRSGAASSAPTFKKIGLTLPKEELNRRINERVRQMIRQGWIEETEWLLKEWGMDAPALQIIGYKEIRLYLTGKLGKDEAIERIKINTRQLAKRQRTWFKRDREIEWINP
ncbi:MAG: tRNA (adenosine(37)-N6)-dimethylallyltransferase MiaA [Deltaproteobacteria bacterium]|nr:tRNA (adenosine(37)-N6)-dimethylallyltransferase MiaA [Deltaproteobacteria bacterium]